MAAVSRYACTSGIRDVTDPLIDNAKEGLAIHLEQADDGADYESPLIQFLTKMEILLGVKIPDEKDAEMRTLACALAADMLRATELTREDYEEDLDDVGAQLDRFIDEAVEKEIESYSETEYSNGYSAGFDEGRREAEEEAETAASDLEEWRAESAPRCPTCSSNEILRDVHNAHVCTCSFCASEWRMIDARAPVAVFGAGAAPVSFLTPESAPATAPEYARACGLESGPLNANEER